MFDNWETMQASDHPSELRIRRVDPKHPLDFFFGKDFQGNYTFIFQGGAADEATFNLPRLAGIDLSLVEKGERKVELRLRLHDKTQVEIFKSLCTSLISATEQLDRTCDISGFQIILLRLQHWQELLKATREKLLSRNEIVGLLGEILVLKDLFLKSLSPLDAINTWRGPFGDEQDFLHNGWRLEVKTQLSSSDSKLFISSVNQLDTISGPIVLCHQLVSVAAEDHDSAYTLNSAVQEVTQVLKHDPSAAIDIFQMALCEMGYMQREEYGDTYYILEARSYYEVVEGFPALTPILIPAGVEDVKYSVRLNNCLSFVVREQQVLEWIF